jgi:hypothetical protein
VFDGGAQKVLRSRMFCPLLTRQCLYIDPKKNYILSAEALSKCSKRGVTDATQGRSRDGTAMRSTCERCIVAEQHKYPYSCIQKSLAEQ